MKRNQRNETVDEFLLTSSAVIVASYASVRRTVCDQRIVRGGDSQFAKLRMSTARRNHDPRKQTTAEHDETPADENSKTLNKLARKEL